MPDAARAQAWKAGDHRGNHRHGKLYKGSMVSFESPVAVADTVDVWWTRTGLGLPAGHFKGIVTVARLVMSVIPHSADLE